MTSAVFFRMKWMTNPIQVKLWYGDPKSTKIEKEILRFGSDFNIKIGNERYCIGSESNKGEWITCKERRIRDNEDNVIKSLKFKNVEDSSTFDEDDNNVVILVDKKNYIQCYRCSTVEYFRCRMTCLGDYCDPTSELAKKICQPPNTSVYLTFVGGEIKIGVSLGIPRRWLEQGSDLATIVATAPGLEARRLEQYAANRLNLKLQVRNSTKIHHLNNVDMDLGYKKMNETIENIQPLIEEILKDIPGYTARSPEIKDLHEYYGDLSFKTPIQEVDVLPGNEFGGKIVGMKGSFLIVNQGTYHYALDMKKLMSREFEFLERKANIATQSYLDQWF